MLQVRDGRGMNVAVAARCCPVTRRLNHFLPASDISSTRWSRPTMKAAGPWSRRPFAGQRRACRPPRCRSGRSPTAATRRPGLRAPLPAGPRAGGGRLHRAGGGLSANGRRAGTQRWTGANSDSDDAGEGLPVHRGEPGRRHDLPGVSHPGRARVHAAGDALGAGRAADGPASCCGQPVSAGPCERHDRLVRDGPDGRQTA